MVKMPKEAVILILTDLEDDDFESIVDNLEFPDNVLIVSDFISHKNSTYPHLIRDSFQNLPKLKTKILSWSKKNGKKIIKIIGTDEEHHYSYSYQLSAILRIPYHHKRALDLASNKYLQREAFLKEGLHVPRFKLFRDPSEIRSFPYPNVLKIITGYASQHVYLNQNAEQLSANLKKIISSSKKKSPLYRTHLAETDQEKDRSSGKKILFSTKLDPLKQFLVEEFIGGDEYSCDFLIETRKGKISVNVLRVAKKLPSSNFSCFEGYLLFNPDSEPGSDFTVSQLKGSCLKIAKAFGAKEGVCMVDFKFWNDKIYIIESTLRPGISNFIELMAKLYHTTSFNQLIRSYLNLPLKNTKGLPTETGTVLYILTTKKGKIARLDFSQVERLYHSSLIRICAYKKQGDHIEDKNSSSSSSDRITMDQLYENFPSYLAHLLFRGLSLNRLDKDIEKIKSCIRLDVKE